MVISSALIVERKAKAQVEKQKGNAAYSECKYWEARNAYAAGVEAILGTELEVPLLKVDKALSMIGKELLQTLVLLYSNLSLTSLHLEGHEAAAYSYAEACARLSSMKWAKAFVRLGAAAESLGRKRQAVDEYLKGLKLLAVVGLNEADRKTQQLIQMKLEGLFSRCRRLSEFQWDPYLVPEGAERRDLVVSYERGCAVGLCLYLPSGISLSPAAAAEKYQAKTVSFVYYPQTGVYVHPLDKRVPHWVTVDPDKVHFGSEKVDSHAFYNGYKKSLASDHPKGMLHYMGLGVANRSEAKDGNKMERNVEDGYWDKKEVAQRLRRQEECARLYGSVGAPEYQWLMEVATEKAPENYPRENKSYRLRVSSVQAPTVFLLLRVPSTMRLGTLGGRVLCPLVHEGDEVREYYFHDCYESGLVFSRVPRGACGPCRHSAIDGSFRFLHGYGVSVDDSTVCLSDLMHEVGMKMEFTIGYDVRETLLVELEEIGPLPAPPHLCTELLFAHGHFSDLRMVGKFEELPYVERTGTHLGFAAGTVPIGATLICSVGGLHHRRLYSPGNGTAHLAKVLAKSVSSPSPYWSDGLAKCKCCAKERTRNHIDARPMDLCAHCGVSQPLKEEDLRTLKLCGTCKVKRFCSTQCYRAAKC